MLRVIVAPHMDDESMGCGGLLAKYPDECVVITVAESGEVRRAEHEKAMGILGVTRHENLGFSDAEVGASMAKLVAALDERFEHYQPDEVYLPYPSLHQDHIAVYEAGMRSGRVSMSATHWFPPTVLVYDIAAYDVNLYPTDLRWNVFETLDKDMVQRKQDACAAYVSEMPGGVHPISSVVQIAEAIGATRLVPYAEQYALVRWLRP